MDNASFRKNVFKTLSQKPAKLGLKIVSRNTRRTNIFHAISGIAAETLELVGAMGPYIVGAKKFDETMKNHALEESGDLAYFIAVAAKMLKVKVPGSGKKVKLKGMTRSEALVQLASLASDMFDLVKKNFYGPKMKEGERVKKVYELGKDGVVDKTKFTEVVDKIQVIDAEATEAMYVEREAKLADLLGQYIALFWGFCYATFEAPPATLYAVEIAKLEKRYGQGFFDLKDSEERDPEAEKAVMAEKLAEGQPAATAKAPAKKTIGKKKAEPAAPAAV